MMNSWIQTLIWGIGCLSGLLVVYMVTTNQIIRWQRERGLLVRQSHGLYWSVLAFLKTYLWVFTIIGLMGVSCVIVMLVLGKSWGRGPHTDLADNAVLIGGNSKVKNIGMPMEELRTWVLQLEDRRHQAPQDYCGRIQHGILSFEQAENPSVITKSKLRYLKSEYQKYCSPGAGEMNDR